MNLTGITFTGPAISDPAMLARLSPEHRALLEEINGFVAFEGGLHVRGICEEPRWHSLGDVWLGEEALHRAYPELTPDDVPFAQDPFGDQLLLRGDRVIRLSGEDGSIEPLKFRLREFLEHASANPVEFLDLHAFDGFQLDGGVLRPGELINVTPPFISPQSANGVTLTVVPVEERLATLKRLAAAMRRSN